MNESFLKYFEALRTKKVTVLGIGVSNRPLVRMLLQNGVKVTICDKQNGKNLDEEVMDFLFFGAKFCMGDNYLDHLDADVIFRSPGIRPDLPQLQNAVKNGAVLTSEMEAFFEVCPCKIIAVTGSDGKTTTTTLIAEMLRRADHRVWLGGNIGQPLLMNAEQMEENDFAVVELSSFQLMTMKKSADIAVVTNVAPNHLDWHRGFEEYVQAKKNVFLHQNRDGVLVVNGDNENTDAFKDEAKGTVLTFSREKNADVYFENGRIYCDEKPLICAEKICISGMHNVENYMAALCAVRPFVSDEDVVFVAEHFQGVEHRMEPVRELDGVKYYNDSIASSPSRTIAGLKVFSQKVILIAGGYDKQIPFDKLGKEICSRVKVLILCGATADKIKTAVLAAENYNAAELLVLQTDSLNEAVLLAHEKAVSGDVVALSPACASFDQFRNFSERGNCFKKFVMEL